MPMTYSLIHSDFSNGLVRKGKIGLSLSPIVSFKATDPSSKVTTVLSCAIISPLMILASGNRLCDSQGYFHNRKPVLTGVIKDETFEIQIKEMKAFEKGKIVLMVMEEPMWKLGWCGITQLASPILIE